jgi:RHS repeat-associated protein
MALWLASAGVLAEAATSKPGPDAKTYSQICAAPVRTTTPPGPSVLRPGRYFDPARSGQGWDFHWYGGTNEGVAGDKLFVQWFTFEVQAGNVQPVWYGAISTVDSWSEPGELIGGERLTWVGKVYRFKQVGTGANASEIFRQWAPGVEAGVAIPGLEAEYVGDLQLFFGVTVDGEGGLAAGGRPNQVAAQWALRPRQGFEVNATPQQDCMTNFITEAHARYPQPESGVYQERSASGIFWNPVLWREGSQTSTDLREHHGLAYFDATGSPRWLVGGPREPLPPTPGDIACTGAEPPWVAGALPGNYVRICMMAILGYKPWLRQGDNGFGWSRIEIAALGRGQWGSGAHLNDYETNIRLAWPQGAAISVFGAPDIVGDGATVRKTVGLTRASFTHSNGSLSLSETQCIVGGPTGGNHGGIPGVCRLIAHWMTEDWFPDLTVVMTRLNGRYSGGGNSAATALDEFEVIDAGRLRSPIGGKAIPHLIGGVTAGPMAAGPIIGDRIRIDVFDSPTRNRRVFSGRELLMVRDPNAFECANGTRVLESTPTISIDAPNGVLRTTGTISNVVPSKQPTGFRFRLYRAENNAPHSFVGHRTVWLGQYSGQFQASAEWPRLPTGRRYFAQVDAFNECNQISSTMPPSGAYELTEHVVADAPLTPATPPTSDAVPVGVIAGEGGVSGGSATFEVPIVVPPGRRGMQPAVTLSYSSRNGNGPLGVGWSMSAAGSIHRCPRTVAQDGETRGIDFGPTDRLCLDGERLVLVNGAYGQSGAEYRTEVDRFARIRQVASLAAPLASATNTTPFVFEVDLKSGLIERYGGNVLDWQNNATSVVTMADTGRARHAIAWNLATRVDRSGNNISFKYVTFSVDALSVEHLLTEIAYTGHGSARGNRTVRFMYGTRPTATDGGSTYLSGAAIGSLYRLESVVTRIDATKVREYLLDYGVASPITGRSVLRSVSECAYDSIGTNSSCRLPLQIRWTGGTNAPPSFVTRELGLPASLVGNPAVVGDGVLTPTVPPVLSLRAVGDLDGDGTVEQLLTRSVPPVPPAQTPTVTMHLVKLAADRSVVASVEVPATWAPQLVLDSGDPVDLDNDGRVDLVGVFGEGAPGNATALGECKLRGTCRTMALRWTGVHTDWRNRTFGELFGFVDVTRSPLQPAGAHSRIFVHTARQYTGGAGGTGSTFVTADEQMFFVDVTRDGLPELVVVRTPREPNDPAWGGAPAGVTHAGSCAIDNRQGYGPVLLVYRNDSTRGGSIQFNEAPIYGRCMAGGRRPGSSDFERHEYDRITNLMDLDGDSLPELFVDGRPGGLPHVLFGVRGAGGTFVFGSDGQDQSANQVRMDRLGPQMDSAESRPTWMDVNGDGLMDAYYRLNCGPTNQQLSLRDVVRLNLGKATRPASGEIGLFSRRSVVDQPDGGDGWVCAGVNPQVRLPFSVVADVDSDGRDDIVRPTAFAVRRCTLIRETDPTTSGAGAGSPPAPPQRLTYYCPEAPVGSSGALPQLLEGQPPKERVAFMYASGKAAWDQSLYFTEAIRFGRVGRTLNDTPTFISRRFDRQLVTDASGSGIIDQYGDGLPDAMLTVRCPVSYGEGILPCPRVLEDSPMASGLSAPGLYISENVGAGAQAAREPLLPDLVRQVAKQGRFANANYDIQHWSFDYAPLSSSAGRPSSALRLYELPTGVCAGELPPEVCVNASNLYFTSSMPVVAEMRVSAGATRMVGGRPATGQHVHAFGYREALYDRSGRGFRGFRSIIEEVDAVPADDRPVLPGSRTVTRFHQEYPLTSAVDCAMTSSTARPLGTLTCSASTVPSTGSYAGTHLTAWSGTSYDIVRSDGLDGIHYYDVRTTGQRSRTFKPELVDPALVTDTTASTPSDAYDAYGNLTRQVVTSTEYVDATRSINRTASTDIRFLEPDLREWFIDRIAEKSVVSSITSTGMQAAPVGAGSASKRQTYLYGHDYDPEKGTGTRQINCEATFDGRVGSRTPVSCDGAAGFGGWNSTVTTAFDTYGNATSITRQFRRTTGAASLSEVPEPLKRTETIEFGNGYFPVVTRNAKQHATCIDTDPRFGLVSKTRRLMNASQTCANPADGLATTSEFDAFGLVIKQTYPSASNAASVQMVEAQPAFYARYWCISSGNCPPYFGTAVWRETRIQQGAPSTAKFFDAQGRVIGERLGTLSGWVDSVRMHDDLGRPVFESAPSFAVTAFGLGNPESDLSLATRVGVHRNFDIFGRERIKRQVRNRLDGTSGLQVMLTRYTPDRLGTALTVRNCTGVSVIASGEVPVATCTGEHGTVLSMSRAMDAGGRPIEVIDALAGTSRYWYDATGNVIALQDPSGNAITASYDNLGRRTASIDPNQGTHTFEYNGLGELVLSRDGRGWRTAMVRDVLGRVEARRWTEPMGAIQPAVLQSGEDLWTYDTLGFGLTTSEQRRLSLASSPTTVYERLERTFEYADPLYRLTSTTSRALMPDGTTDLLTRRQYWDANFGRIKQTSWPQLASVAYRYAASGHLQDTYEVGTPSTSYLTRTVSVNPTGTAMQSRMADGTQLRCVIEDPSTGMVTAIDSGVATSGAACGQIANHALKLSYRYDGFGNLARTQNESVPSGGSAPPLIETFEYDALHRLRGTAVPRQSLAIAYAYHPNGNFKHKSDYTTATDTAYVYGTGNAGGVVDAGPNAATEVSVLTPAGCKDRFWYDDNGNLNARASGVCGGNIAVRTGAEWIDYTIDNLPKSIATISAAQTLPVAAGAFPTVGTLQSHFRYGPDGQRYFQRMQPGTAIRDTRYDGPYERDRITGNGAGIDGYTQHRLTVTPGVVMTIRESATGFAEPVFHYVHTDRLGSANVVMRGNGTIANSDSFGPFGEPRAANGLPTGVLHPTAGDSDFRYPPAMRRGFTDHEHLDRHALIHMNGRMYDYRLGRFLGVDPIVQFPGFSQSLNAYSYVLNNPLSTRDPSGYASEDRAFAAGMALAAFFGGPSVKEATELTVQAELDCNVCAGRQVASTYYGVRDTADSISSVRQSLDAGELSVADAFRIAGETAIKAAADRGRKGTRKPGSEGSANGATSGRQSAQSSGQSSQIASQAQNNRQAPYAHLEDSASVAPGKEFTRAQKRKMMAANRERNGGVLVDDEDGQPLVPAEQSKKGVTPPPNEAAVDHYIPRSKDGPNSYKNAQIIARKRNSEMGNKDKEEDTGPREIPVCRKDGRTGGCGK